MLRNIISFLFLFIAVISAADLNYIMALKPPITDQTYKQVEADVKAAGGEVTYEFRTAFKAVLICLPSERVSTLESKPYVDFIEQDKSVHTA